METIRQGSGHPPAAEPGRTATGDSTHIRGSDPRFQRLADELRQDRDRMRAQKVKRPVPTDPPTDEDGAAEG